MKAVELQVLIIPTQLSTLLRLQIGISLGALKQRP